jgi:peptide/nickel transport system substrate-binding protein
MALAACTQTGTTPPASATAAAKRGAGDALKILYWQAPTILNSHQATGTKDYDAARLILEPLASWGPDGKPLANGLASEIPTLENNGVSKDFTTVTWKLRTGLKWSDGTPFTADDVVFTWKYMADDATASSDSDYSTGVKSVVAKDPTTAVVTYAEANPNYYQFGVGGNNNILQKKQFESALGAKASESPENLKPIGTGPYKLDSFKAGDVVNYVINDNYRDPNKPFFKTVTFKGGGDATTAARAVFQTGDVDYAWNLQVEAPVLRSLIDTGGKGDYLGLAGPNIERVNINFANPDPALGDKRSEPDTKHPFFNGPDGKIVRQALAMASDRATVAKELYGDGLTGKASCNQLNGNPVFESKNTASLPVCKFDVAAAGKLLEDNGWVKGTDGVRAKGGIKLKILYGTTNVSLRQKTQDIMKKGWTEAGFSVELKSVPGSVFFTNTSPDGANKMYYDVTMYTNGTDPDPTTYMSSWTCKNVTAKANNWNSPNYHRYCNPAYDALVDQLRKESDAAKRNDLAIKANDILVGEVVTIPLVNRFAVASGRSKSLKGVVLTGWDSEMWQIADWTK